MNIFVKRLSFIVAAVLLTLGARGAGAAVILAQIIDMNPPIYGMTYVDGVLTQRTLLGQESYDGRFTGFILLNSAALREDIDLNVNIFSSSGNRLIGTLAFGGIAGGNFLHTSYFSATPERSLALLPPPSITINADRSFYEVLKFQADNNDQYIFQYKSVEGKVSEPPTALTFAIGVMLICVGRRIMYVHEPTVG